MDRQHTGGEIQCFGGFSTLRIPGDEFLFHKGCCALGAVEARGGSMNSCLSSGRCPYGRVLPERFARPLDRRNGPPTGGRPGTFLNILLVHLFRYMDSQLGATGQGGGPRRFTAIVLNLSRRGLEGPRVGCPVCAHFVHYTSRRNRVPPRRGFRVEVQ